MNWSKIETKNIKPFGWWIHKILCEFGYWVYETFNSVLGQKMYYYHLNKMCEDYKINLYGEDLKELEDVIGKLIKELEDENAIILKRKPSVALSFDWSGDDYRYTHNEEIIKRLKLI